MCKSECEDKKQKTEKKHNELPIELNEHYIVGKKKTRAKQFML